jgi:hypothetical protein
MALKKTCTADGVVECKAYADPIHSYRISSITSKELKCQQK